MLHRKNYSLALAFFRWARRYVSATQNRKSAKKVGGVSLMKYRALWLKDNEYSILWLSEYDRKCRSFSNNHFYIVSYRFRHYAFWKWKNPKKQQRLVLVWVSWSTSPSFYKKVFKPTSFKVAHSFLCQCVSNYLRHNIYQCV